MAKQNKKVRLADIVHAAYLTGIPLCIWGDPGLGKSAIVEYTANKIGVPCEIIISSTREPSDFSGLPLIVKDEEFGAGVKMIPPSWAKQFNKEGQKGMVFFDELSTCNLTIQAALLRVVHEGVVGEYKLPKSVYRIAASNFTNIEGCNELGLAMANRFIHVVERYDNEDFCDSLMCGYDYPLMEIKNNKEDPIQFRKLLTYYRGIIADFLRSTLGKYGYDIPKEITKPEDYAYPTKRSWENAANVLATLHGNDQNLVKSMMCGLVGEEATKAFYKHAKVVANRKFIVRDHLDDYETTFTCDPSKIKIDELNQIVKECIYLRETQPSAKIDKMATYIIDELVKSCKYDEMLGNFEDEWVKKTFSESQDRYLESIIASSNDAEDNLETCEDLQTLLKKNNII